MNDLIQKTRWCEECLRSGKRATQLRYAGCQKISPTITIVAFDCEHGHHTGENMQNEIAQKLIRHAKGERC